MKEDIMKKQKEEPGEESKGAAVRSRRSILKGSALLLMGGIAGRISNANSAPAPTFAPAPPLPWKWTKLDPMEAGRRAYRFYLKNKG
jgi:hypothetical protein